MSLIIHGQTIGEQRSENTTDTYMYRCQEMLYCHLSNISSVKKWKQY